MSSSFGLTVLPELAGIRETPPAVQRAFLEWQSIRDASLGPASSVRAVTDIAVVPLAGLLGFQVARRNESPERCDLILEKAGAAVSAAVTPWSLPLDAGWRRSVLSGITVDARWCLSTNGRSLRLIDAHRTWTRHYLEFDLDALAHVPDALTLFWTLMRPEAMTGADPLLDRAIEASARHGVEVCRSLAGGVLSALELLVQALAPGRPRGVSAPLPPLLEQSLTVLYRVLFLLFAEARGLVPVWHPVYRDRYTIDSIVTALLEGRRYRGAWQALQAIARLAHAGCRAGDLAVTAFNGRLFSPVHTPSASRSRVDDRTMAGALLAVSTMKRPGATRARIAYRDLDVEQLGAVYEHVLDYRLERSGNDIALRRAGDVRKASGTFYTPRPVTSWLVRHTLGPLVRDLTAEQILRLRVLDPAMGSGAFLVAACRYLAEAAESARIRDGEWDAGDVTAEDRVALRRAVAQRCLFGVDLNPMAVQLARLSLWLATLAADKPLTFLDHRLVPGDSLVGGTFAQAASRAPGRSARPRSLPLFEEQLLGELARSVVPVRRWLGDERDDAAAVVERKESELGRLRAEGSAAARWKEALDLWCACWFWRGGPPPNAALFHELADGILHGRRTLPARSAAEWRASAKEVAGAQRFLHWELEFPEVFFDERGGRLGSAGFDAVIGNPPWDMVRADSGDSNARSDRRAAARCLLEFVRGSGIYALEVRSHVNRYQLFVERALQLLRPGGRFGLVVPGGFVSDAGSGPLRRFVLDRARLDTVTGLDNRLGVFPIHRSVRFVLVTGTTGCPTDRIPCRFGVSDPEALDERPEPDPVIVSRALLARLSGEDDLAIPQVSSPADLRILEKISMLHPRLSSADGWNAHFGRELNASDDRAAFRPATGADGARPVLEGKHLMPFRVALERSALEVRPGADVSSHAPRRPRLAYREVASATNRLTLIAAIVPARAVTTHTLFCLRNPLPLRRQLVLCALLNSLVANYLVRFRVHTHVTAAILSTLPVPWIPPGDPDEALLRQLAERLGRSCGPVEEQIEYAALQALAARRYGLTPGELERVVDSFPLLPAPVRRAVVEEGARLHLRRML